MLKTKRKDNGTVVARVDRSADSGGADSGSQEDELSADTNLEDLDSFPARSTLIENDYTTVGDVREASDEDLLSLDGIADTTLQKIKEAV